MTGARAARTRMRVGIGYGAVTTVRSGKHPADREVVTPRRASDLLSMTVCVTGATGFVGAHVVRLLVRRGEAVRAIYRNESRLSRLGSVDAQPVKADVLDRAAMRRAMRGCEVLYHSAGVVG